MAELPRIPSVPGVPGAGGLHEHNERLGEVGDAIQHHAGIGAVDSNGKKDWHDWEAIAREEQRTGE